MLKNICVYCGSASGVSSVYVEAATQLGQTLARRGTTLVYGGAQVGLMGDVADGALSAGGTVIGVIPRFMEVLGEPQDKLVELVNVAKREIVHRGLTELYLVDSMHERKAQMAALSDGFIVLPGGFGTLDEIFEMLTWAQLGLHSKPCGFWNINDYYTPLCQFLDNMETEGFLATHHRTMPFFENDLTSLLEKMEEGASVAP
jgi:uncharacterized protein (TIGR00730 family)